MPVEICASSITSAKNAQKGGADRIELCSELASGGITPSYGTIKEVLSRISLPVFVLIRPRSGDFVYSEEEFEIMKTDIKICKELGCAGIVSGVLIKDGSIDKARTGELIELSRPMEFTFHKAFDETPNAKNALDVLLNLGADRILTSGQKPTAKEGLEVLIELKEKAKGRLKILVGGSVRPENAELFKNAGFEEIHSSAVISNEDRLYTSDLGAVKELVEIMK